MTGYELSDGWLTTRSPRTRDRATAWGRPERREAVQVIGDRTWPSVPPLDRVDDLAEALVPPPAHGRDQPGGHIRVRDWIDDPLWSDERAHDQLWELDLVVDAGPTMPIWDDTVADVVAALRRTRAFHSVDVHELDTRRRDLRVCRPLDRRVAPAEPASGGPSSRMVLVLTDGLGSAWSAGSALHLLRAWGHDAAVAIVHLLPAPLWGIAGVTAQRARLRSRSPGGPSAAIECSLSGDGGLPVPVLELSSRWLRTWTRLLTRSPAWTDLPVATPSPKWTFEPGGTEPTAGQRVVDFRTSASGQAFTLATLLAAAPLNLPVIRMIQGKWLPLSLPHHLAEILAAGLLRPVVDAPAVFAPDRITYEFLPGVRRELLGLSRRGTTGEVARTAADCLGHYVECVRDFGEVLRDPPTAEGPALTPENQPYNEVFHAVLEALSGPYLGHARRLARGLGEDGGS